MACGRIVSGFASVRQSGTRAALGVLIAAAVAVAAPAATADPIKASVIAAVNDGYARLVFSMSDYDDASVRQAGNVLIISFKAPIAVSVDRLAMQAPAYIGAARSDPDGKAVRLALARKVTVNTMTAGEKLFVDLLPDTWTGLPPGLPQDVVDELARRAREAEQHALRARIKVQTKRAGPVHVRVATQPTFTRYVFEIPGQISVGSDRAKDRFTLTFDAPLKFDLGDVNAALPRAIGAVTSETEDGSASVRFNFRAKVEVRTFRDENGYIVDVVGANAASVPSGAHTQTPPPATVPSPRAAAKAGAPATQAVADAIAHRAAQTVVLPPAAPVAPPQTPTVNPPAPAAAAPNKPPVAAKTEPAAGIAKPAVPVAPVAHPAPAGPAARVEPPPAAPNPARPAPARAAASPPPRPALRSAGGKVAVELARQGTNLKLTFDLMSPVAAAVFQRADTLWIVFDSKADIDLAALQGEASRTIRSAVLIRAPDADIVRIKLDHPRLSSVATEGPVWTVEIGDSVFNPSRALDLNRNLIGHNRSSISIPFGAPHQLHRIVDPEAGDQLLVVTGFAPARGVVHAQDFIEFHALASAQGIVVEPLADDIGVGLAPDKVVISRPGGLTLSSSLQLLLRGDGLRPTTFDSQIWGFDRRGSFQGRQAELIAAAAVAPVGKRTKPRLDLARFYLAREMYAEAKGVLDVVLSDRHAAAEDVSAVVMRAVADIMMNRPEDALKDLANPSVGDQHDAPLWRALAYARQGKWSQARAGFRTVEAAVATLPIELQRMALKEAMRAAIEVGDFAEAENELNDLETIGVPRELQPAVSVLIGRLDEGLGRSEDALAAYRTAVDSWDRPSAAQGRLRETVLRRTLGDLKREDVISELESLTTVWRGDETEIEALQVLARLYTEQGRFRDSFYVMRSAMAAHPDWDMTRKIQEEAARTFDSLFLAGQGDTLPAIDALALFYDFRELTPIGSRGDDMIRRLADRLVSVDLLDQAAGLLQYQVDKRLQGAARAQVATRLAVIYLMNRKPDRALAVLQATRAADLSTELRNQRLLLEARSLSDLGRHDLAIEVTANVPGRETIRLRSDIYWSARRWSQAAEQIELLYGDRWKQWQPLTSVERSDILRAEVGYALAEDTLGLGRFREKYAAKMAGTPEARAFEIVSTPLGNSGEDFRSIAHAAAAQDTLDDFLRAMKARYPESSPVSEPAAERSAAPSAGAPAGKIAPAPPSAPQTRPSPTPAPAAPSASAGRTAMR